MLSECNQDCQIGNATLKNLRIKSASIQSKFIPSLYTAVPSQDWMKKNPNCRPSDFQVPLFFPHVLDIVAYIMKGDLIYKRDAQTKVDHGSRESICLNTWNHDINQELTRSDRVLWENAMRRV